MKHCMSNMSSLRIDSLPCQPTPPSCLMHFSKDVFSTTPLFFSTVPMHAISAPYIPPPFSITSPLHHVAPDQHPTGLGREGATMQDFSPLQGLRTHRAETSYWCSWRWSWFETCSLLSHHLWGAVRNGKDFFQKKKLHGRLQMTSPSFI